MNVVINDRTGSCLPFSIEADYPYELVTELNDDFSSVGVSDSKDQVDQALARIQKRIDEYGHLVAVDSNGEQSKFHTLLDQEMQAAKRNQWILYLCLIVIIVAAAYFYVRAKNAQMKSTGYGSLEMPTTGNTNRPW